MPSKTAAQHRLMEAAAHTPGGYGGVPQKVGKEFVAHDVKPIAMAAGILFLAPDGDVLLLRRATGEPNYGGYWALPGGKANDDETPQAAADREAREELGFNPGETRKRLLDRRVTPNGMIFHTYVQPTADKFVPQLNGEHSGYCWAPLDALPQPVHPGVAATLKDRGAEREAGSTAEDWAAIVRGLLTWAEAEPANPAMDESPNRSFDIDGRMHVQSSNISKANICEYYGREIPRGAELGLDPDQKYKLLRHPDELAKAAATFNNLPLLARHVPVTAEDHQPHLIIGTTGTDAKFEAPYLTNSVSVWAGGAIGAIEAEVMKELSSAYHYRADMTPGEYEGEKYDGVMRDIIGNHVALVRAGRAGDDVVVGDSKPEELNMTKTVLSRKATSARGALIAYLMPKLAMDAKVDITPIFEGVTALNFKAKKTDIASGVKKVTAGKLAQDADLNDITNLLDALECDPVMEGADADPDGNPMSKEDLAKNLTKPANDEDDEEGEKKKREFLKGKLTAEDMKAYDAMGGRMGKDGKTGKDADPDDKDKDAKTVSKPAMDAAIAAAVTSAEQNVRASMKATQEAMLAVEPYVGRLAMAFDSAPEVYRSAFKVLGVDITGVPPEAFPAILRAQPKPGAKQAPLGMDQALDVSSFHTRFPDAKRISSL